MDVSSSENEMNNEEIESEESSDVNEIEIRYIADSDENDYSDEDEEIQEWIVGIDLW